MKSKVKILGIIVSVILLVFVLFIGSLYINNDIGVSANNLEADIRSSQKIKDDWTVDGSISDTMAAFISYPQDKSDHTFSIYVNRAGLSLGYFFRSGGDIVEVEKSIAEYTIEGYGERAFISMNEQKVASLEINDGSGVEKIKLDSNKPFAIILPINAGSITFFNENGEIVDYSSKTQLLRQ